MEKRQVIISFNGGFLSLELSQREYNLLRFLKKQNLFTNDIVISYPTDKEHNVYFKDDTLNFYKG